jgi:hypothetical protein
MGILGAHAKTQQRSDFFHSGDPPFKIKFLLSVKKQKSAIEYGKAEFNSASRFRDSSDALSDAPKWAGKIRLHTFGG